MLEWRANNLSQIRFYRLTCNMKTVFQTQQRWGPSPGASLLFLHPAVQVLKWHFMCTAAKSERVWCIHYSLDNYELLVLNNQKALASVCTEKSFGITTWPGIPSLRGGKVRKGSTYTMLTPISGADSSGGLSTFE